MRNPDTRMLQALRNLRAEKAQAHAAGYTLGASFRTVRRLGSSASNVVGVLRAEDPASDSCLT